MLYIHEWVSELVSVSYIYFVFIFNYIQTQTGNLVYASPATISRVGVVFVDSNQLGYKPFWQRWLRTRPKHQTRILQVHLHVIYRYGFRMKHAKAIDFGAQFLLVFVVVLFIPSVFVIVVIVFFFFFIFGGWHFFVQHFLMDIYFTLSLWLWNVCSY